MTQVALSGGGGGILAKWTFSDKTGDVSFVTPNVFSAIGKGTGLSVKAAVGDLIRAELSGTFYVSAGASGFLSLMVDFQSGGARWGGPLGLEYESVTAFGTSYGFHAVGWHTVASGDLSGGSVAVTPMGGHDVGTGTLGIQNNANLFMVSSLMNVARAA